MNVQPNYFIVKNQYCVGGKKYMFIFYIHLSSFLFFSPNVDFIKSQWPRPLSYKEYFYGFDKNNSIECNTRICYGHREKCSIKWRSIETFKIYL